MQWRTSLIRFAGMSSCDTLPRMARVMVWMVLITLITAWLAGVVLVETSEIVPVSKYELIPGQEQAATTEKQPGLVFYALQGCSLASCLFAGFLALFIGYGRRLSLLARVALATLLFSAIVWFVLSYGPSDIFSAELISLTGPLSATGPFVWITLLFVLAGMESAAWKIVDSLVHVLSLATAALTVLAMITADRSFHWYGFSKFIEYTTFLAWMGGYTFLKAKPEWTTKYLVRCIPIIVMFFTSMMNESRSWTIITLLLVICAAIFHGGSKGAAVGIRIARAGAALAVLAVLLGLASLLLPQYVQGLADRIDEDTRSNQFEDFFQDVGVHELIAGRGPNGTWFWRLVGEYRFFDNGYLWMLFLGGLPLCLS